MACFSAFASKYVGSDEDNHSMSTIGRDGCKGGIIKNFIYIIMYNLCFDKKSTIFKNTSLSLGIIGKYCNSMTFLLFLLYNIYFCFNQYLKFSF